MLATAALCQDGQAPATGAEPGAALLVRSILLAGGIAAAARGMREAVRTGDLEAAGACLRQEWRWRRRLSPEIGRGGVEPLIRRAVRAGALGAKPCGAGGGGCVLVLCEESSQKRIEAALRGSGARRLPFRVVRRGLRVNNLDAGRAGPV